MDKGILISKSSVNKTQGSMTFTVIMVLKNGEIRYPRVERSETYKQMRSRLRTGDSSWVYKSKKQFHLGMKTTVKDQSTTPCILLVRLFF